MIENQEPDNTEEDLIYEISTLDEKEDESLAERAVNQPSSDWSLFQELIFTLRLPRSIKNKIDLLTRKAKKECNKEHAPPKKVKGALRKNYQAFQRGEKEFISNEKWKKAKKSEMCTTCVLDGLCKNASIQDLLIKTNQPP